VGHLKRLAAKARRLKPPALETRLDIAFVAALSSIAAGCGWIYPPSAPIVAGVLALGFVWLLQRGITAGEPPPPTVTRVAGSTIFEPADADDEDD
jgi:hypothetical protein